MLNCGMLIWSPWPEMKAKVLIVVSTVSVLKNVITRQIKRGRGVGLIKISGNVLLLYVKRNTVPHHHAT
jgi:hypothetical protein